MEKCWKIFGTFEETQQRAYRVIFGINLIHHCEIITILMLKSESTSTNFRSRIYRGESEEINPLSRPFSWYIKIYKLYLNNLKFYDLKFLFKFSPNFFQNFQINFKRNFRKKLRKWKLIQLGSVPSVKSSPAQLSLTSLVSTRLGLRWWQKGLFLTRCKEFGDSQLVSCERTASLIWVSGRGEAKICRAPKCFYEKNFQYCFDQQKKRMKW